MTATVRWILGIALVGVAVLVATWALWEPLAFLRRDLAANRPLWEDDVAALEACADPGSSGLAKVLEQDLAIPCSDDWFASTLAGHLEGRALEWTSLRAHDPQRSVRVRMRAATALLYAGQPAVPGLAFLATDPALDPRTRDDVVEALLEARFETTWADPVLMEQVTHRRFAGGEVEAAASEVRTLRLAAVIPSWLPQEERAERARAVVHAAGLGDGVLEQVRARQAAGMPLDLPPDLARFVSRDRDACTDWGSDACLRFAASLVEQGLVQSRDGEPGWTEDDPEPNVTLPEPLWLIAYDGDRLAVRAAGETLGAVAAWVAEAAEHERADRLLGAVASPRSSYTAARVREGRTGDPVHVVPARGGTPWSVALAATAIGHAAGVEVRVSLWEDGVVIGAGGRAARVGPCGAVSRPDPLQTAGEPWSVRAVMAQATLEAVGAALRDGRATQARRLAILASRLDPVGTQDVVSTLSVEAPDEDPSAGLARVGAELLEHAAPDDALAMADRRQRAHDVLASMDSDGEAAGCPGVLER